MKEENRLLKQKNASMTRKKEHYESEISRLNKVGTGVSANSFNSGISVVSDLPDSIFSILGEQPGGKLMITIWELGKQARALFSSYLCMLLLAGSRVAL